MGVSRQIRCRARPVRVLGVAGLAVMAVGAVVGCQPGGPGSAAVAYTTDTTATAELKRQHVHVSWLTCTGNYGSSGSRTPGRAPSPTQTTVVSVDCQGQTDDLRKITVVGVVTKAVDGACVRGDLTARVEGKQVFHVGGLGNCNAKPGPTYAPPVTYRPSGAQPTVTVTVTRTIWCKGDPTCWPAQGK